MRYFWSRVRHLLPLILGHIVNVCFCALGFLSTAINYLRGNTHKKSAKLFFTESPENPIFSNLRLRFAHFSGGIDGRSDSSNNNTVFAILTMTKRKKNWTNDDRAKKIKLTPGPVPQTPSQVRERERCWRWESFIGEMIANEYYAFIYLFYYYSVFLFLYFFSVRRAGKTRELLVIKKPKAQSTNTFVD